MYMIYLLVGFLDYAYHDMVSYYDITFTSLFINYRVILDFCQHCMYDISYDTSIIIYNN
jgi:hypothetical protein